MISHPEQSIPAPIPLVEARARLLSTVPSTVPTEAVSLPEALGRWLATDLATPESLPPVDQSLMDGYAVGGSSGPWRLLPRRVGPGDPPSLDRLESDAGVRVLTGAPLPPGTWAVVRQEDAEVDSSGTTLRSVAVVDAGAHVRHRASDAPAGQILVRAGERVDPGTLALLSTLGVAAVPVRTRPRVHVIPTGSELRSAGDPTPGGVREASSLALAAQATSDGAVSSVSGCVPDDVEAIVAAIRASTADVVLTTGGASVGDHDFVRAVEAALGARRLFWQVAIRPGRPVLAALLSPERPDASPRWWVALPGNPAASILVFGVVVAPLLRRLAGDRAPVRPTVRAVLDADVRKPAGVEQLVRGTLRADPEGRLRFRPAAAQGSMALVSLHALGAVAFVPAHLTSVSAGTLVDVEPWGLPRPADG